jgi:rhamnosyl/mannosyltransferase
MVLVEASMFGKPIVSCEIGTGTSFVNVNGETGFVVEPESPGALAGSMNALLRDRLMTERFGRAARKRYEALFSGPALGIAHARLYREVSSD